MHVTVRRLALVLALALPGVASAQWSPSATFDLGVGFGQMALSQAALSSARRMSETSERAFEEDAAKDRDRAPDSEGGPVVPAVPAVDPRFERSDVVTETVRLRFARFYAGDVLHLAAADIAHAELVRRDDANLLARYRAGLQEKLLPGGPRLDRLEISDQGFVPMKRALP